MLVQLGVLRVRICKLRFALKFDSVSKFSAFDELQINLSSGLFVCLSAPEIGCPIHKAVRYRPIIDLIILRQIQLNKLYVLLTVHPCTILQINPTRRTILFNLFISLLYVFRATMCPSSGEIIVYMRHWYMSFCMGGVWFAGWCENPTSRPDATHTE